MNSKAEVEKVWDKFVVQRCIDSAYEVEGIDQYVFNSEKDLEEVFNCVRATVGWEKLNPEYVILRAVRIAHDKMKNFKNKDEDEGPPMGEYGEQLAYAEGSYGAIRAARDNQPITFERTMPSFFETRTEPISFSQPVILGAEHGVTLTVDSSTSVSVPLTGNVDGTYTITTSGSNG